MFMLMHTKVTDTIELAAFQTADPRVKYESTVTTTYRDTLKLQVKVVNDGNQVQFLERDEKHE